MSDAAPASAGRLVWLALVGAVAAYFVVLVVASRAAPAPADAPMLRTVLLAVAGAQAAAIVALRLRWPDDRTTIPFASHVVAWALAESIALYGLVLGLVTHDVTPARPFFITAVAFLLWLRPRPHGDAAPTHRA